MNQKKMALMLKGIATVVGIMGILFFGILMPIMANDCRISYTEVDYLYWPGMCFGWIIGILCYLALFMFWKICSEIGKDNSFSIENVKALKTIAILAAIAGFMWFAAMLGLICFKIMSIGFFVLMSMAILVSISVSIIAIVLAHLVYKAYELKQETELTI